MTDGDAVLFANEAFYRAFADNDAGAMDDLWATDRPVCCVHPGWAPLYGRDKVMASWVAILGGGQPPGIACSRARAHVIGSAALVTCFEMLSGNTLVATNVFEREGSIWKMVHHHAGPAAVDPSATEEAAPDTPLN